MKQIIAKVSFALLAGIAAVILLAPQIIAAPEKKSEAVVDGKNVVPYEIGKVKAPSSVNLFEVDPVSTCTESWDKFASGEYDCFIGFDARGERHQR